MLKDRCAKQKIYYRKCNGCNQKCKNQKIKVIINYNKFGGYSALDLYNSNRVIKRVVDDLVNEIIVLSILAN